MKKSDCLGEVGVDMRIVTKPVLMYQSMGSIYLFVIWSRNGTSWDADGLTFSIKRRGISRLAERLLSHAALSQGVWDKAEKPRY